MKHANMSLVSLLQIPRAWWIRWALGCRTQTDWWRLRPGASSSARGGQHHSSQADCWGSVLGLGERGPGCVGGAQKRVPAASSEPPRHPERGGVEEGEGRPPFSSSHAPYLHREEERRERGCIWRPLKPFICLLDTYECNYYNENKNTVIPLTSLSIYQGHDLWNETCFVKCNFWRFRHQNAI